MSDTYKLQYGYNTLTYPGWNGYVQYEDVPSFYTLTLQTDGHGTLSATTLTGYPGDTVTLSSTYNTYYRFNNYSVTGGTIADNTFTFGNEDATAQANFKVNYFTATGNFEKGSNTATRPNSTGSTTVNVSEKFALHQAHTGDIPSTWYATSNRWKPNNVSAYSITLNTKMQFSLAYAGKAEAPGVTACSLVGSTQTQSQAFAGTKGSTVTKNYNKTFTTTTQNVNYGVSAKLYGVGKNNPTYHSQSTYVAAGTTGTWTATGIAP